MLNKLKRFPAKKQFEKIEGDFRLVNVAEINELIDSINAELQNVPSPAPYKSLYWALITQSNEDDPSAKVLYNDTGLSVVYTRIAEGVCEITIPGYDPEKMVVEIPNFVSAGFISYQRNGLGEGVRIFTYKTTQLSTDTPSDGLLENTPIKIYIFD